MYNKFDKLLFIFLCISTSACSDPNPSFSVPFGLPAVPWPEDNLYTAEKAELGKKLFFDKRLSSDGTVSCASCHAPSYAFADNKDVSMGIGEQPGTRNSPTIINSAYQTKLFWDGRADTLEEQALGPLSNLIEMTTAPTAHDAYIQCHTRIEEIEEYRDLFLKIFGSAGCSVDHISKAIATFERTILSGNSPYDRFINGEKTALTLEQQKGFELFESKGCAICHSGPNFTESNFANIGIGMDKVNPDLGRYEISKDPKDFGAFKVPTLREVAQTAPYMHDGSLKTLDEVVEHYNKGGIPNSNLALEVHPLYLSEEEKKALVSFLHALSGEGWQHINYLNTKESVF